MAVKSELQLTILKFARDIWKYVYKSPEPARTQLHAYVTAEFEKYKNIPRLKFHQI